MIIAELTWSEVPVLVASVCAVIMSICALTLALTPPSRGRR